MNKIPVEKWSFLILLRLISGNEQKLDTLGEFCFYTNLKVKIIHYI